MVTATQNKIKHGDYVIAQETGKHIYRGDLLRVTRVSFSWSPYPFHAASVFNNGYRELAINHPEKFIEISEPSIVNGTLPEWIDPDNVRAQYEKLSIDLRKLKRLDRG